MHRLKPGGVEAPDRVRIQGLDINMDASGNPGTVSASANVQLVTLTVNDLRAVELRADEATARASRLESRVRALTEELDSRTGYRRVVGESKAWREVLTQATQVAPPSQPSLQFPGAAREWYRRRELDSRK